MTKTHPNRELSRAIQQAGSTGHLSNSRVLIALGLKTPRRSDARVFQMAPKDSGLSVYFVSSIISKQLCQVVSYGE